jgi:hypothetical protein
MMTKANTVRLALFIGAMDANRHVAREELARAHHLIWSTNRFRRKSGETVGRLAHGGLFEFASQGAD